MKFLIDTEKVDLSHLAEAIDAVKDDEIKVGRLSSVTIKYSDRIIVYYFWHNKKSMTVTSHEFPNWGEK